MSLDEETLCLGLLTSEVNWKGMENKEKEKIKIWFDEQWGKTECVNVEFIKMKHPEKKVCAVCFTTKIFQNEFEETQIIHRTSTMKKTARCDYCNESLITYGRKEECEKCMGIKFLLGCVTAIKYLMAQKP